MKFRIEQVALCPQDPEKAIELLTAMGMESWARDVVKASGTVYGVPSDNRAALAFNYEGLSGKELEILHYKDGRNWMSIHRPRVSHLGMHTTEEELEQWREFFAARGVKVCQEVQTLSHTNPVIAGKRSYHYVIFDTYKILGVDIKFIVRQILAE